MKKIFILSLGLILLSSNSFAASAKLGAGSFLQQKSTPTKTCDRTNCTGYCAGNTCKKCSKNSQCGTGYFCNASKGTCSSTPQCSNTNDCISFTGKYGYNCVNGGCEPAPKGSSASCNSIGDALADGSGDCYCNEGSFMYPGKGCQKYCDYTICASGYTGKYDASIEGCTCGK